MGTLYDTCMISQEIGTNKYIRPSLKGINAVTGRKAMFEAADLGICRF